MLRTSGLLLLLLGVATSSLCAGELLPADRPVEDVIDHYVDARIKTDKVGKSDPIGDANAVRRLTLDLAGRIPTAAESREYCDASSAEKRVLLVDRLLASSDFAFHQGNELSALLLGGDVDDKEFREYLRTSARENLAWDAMFRDMLLAEGKDENTKKSVAFLKRRIGNLDDVTNDSSRIFFGVSINCAQCHDHPLVADWEQGHYFGMKSFFARSYVTKKGTLAEKFSGEVKYRNTAGEEQAAKFMFLTGATVAEPDVKKTDEQKKKEDEEVKRQMKDDKAPPAQVPDFSPRRQLVNLALSDENNRFFARSIVNRIWARFMGQGLVAQLDQMHSENPPSHPQLMQWLARDLVQHKYDLKRLIRGIVLSDTYLRSSLWTSDDAAPDPEYFAVGRTRVLTPRQYALSLLIATANPEHLPADVLSEEWSKRREELERQSEGVARELEWPTDHFQVSVDEALLFSNGEKMQKDYLRSSKDRLIGHLQQIESARERIEQAFWSIHTRAPSADELQTLEAFLEKRQDRSEQGLQQVVWAMLTSPELRFNH